MQRIAALAMLCCFVSVLLVLPDEASACRDYDGHRNSVVPPDCGGSYAGGYATGASAGSVSEAIDAVGLPAIFHTIAARESGGDNTAVNPTSGACSAFQFLPSTAASLGYSCSELMADPYTAAQAAKELYDQYGLSPWSLTAY
jgi:hypothetical protein